MLNESSLFLYSKVSFMAVYNTYHISFNAPTTVANFAPTTVGEKTNTVSRSINNGTQFLSRLFWTIHFKMNSLEIPVLSDGKIFNHMMKQRFCKNMRRNKYDKLKSNIIYINVVSTKLCAVKEFKFTLPCHWNSKCFCTISRL